MALWAAAFLSVAQAQTSSNLKEPVVSSDKQAPTSALVSLKQATDYAASEVKGGGLQELRLTARGGSAIAEDPRETCPGDAASENGPAAEPVLMAHAGEGPLSGLAPKIPIIPPIPPPPCLFPSGRKFLSLGFNVAETGAFITQFDATPGSGGSEIGLSQGPAFSFSQMAATIGFSTDGTINAFDYNGYPLKNNPVRYTPGVKYHFLVAADLQTHTYSVLVTPAGGTPVWVAQGYRFRFEQSSVTSLDYWDAYAGWQTLTVCNFSLQ
jgi:hypothetical protein